MSRGWQPLDHSYPSWTPQLLADGHLLWFLDLHPGNERLNVLGVDKETAALPDMDSKMSEMIAAAAAGRSGILVSQDSSNAVIFVHWNDTDGPQPGTTCYMYGDDADALAPLFDAFDQTIHDHFLRETGPTRIYSAFFSGEPPAPEPTGILKLAVDTGLLPSRPIFDPPIGAGPSRMGIHVYDTEQFIEQYGRPPYASYFISAHTEPAEEVPQ